MTLCNDSIKWSELPYPGNCKVYQGMGKTGGSWPLNYFKRGKNKNITRLNGDSIAFPIASPWNYNFLNELKIVETTIKNLTYEETQIAKYWGTGVPINQLEPIILTLINTYKLNPIKSARVASVANKTIMDAFIICWHYKFIWDIARPVQYNNQLKTVITTPQFPAYPSGHSVVSGALSKVLGYFFPKEQEKLNLLAETASISRLYAGVHFKVDVDEGLGLGRAIGDLIIEEIKKDSDIDGILIDIPINEFLDAPIIPDYSKK